MVDDVIRMAGHPRRDLLATQGYRLEQVVADLLTTASMRGQGHSNIFDEENYRGKQSHYLIITDDGHGRE